MLLNKVVEIITFEKSKWLESFIAFNTQKNEASNDFGKDFSKFENNVFYAKSMETIRKRFTKNFFKKVMIRKIIKKQTKLTSNGIQKPYTHSDSYTSKPNEVFINNAIFFRFCCFRIELIGNVWNI